MSPTRKQDDFRSRPIEDWDDWIEKEIQEAMERGEFSDLPGHGKPLRIESNPFDPSMDMAYSRLKNAGYAPTWMELDREITAGRAELEDFLRRSGEYLAHLRSRILSEDAEPRLRETPPPSHPWWAFWRKLRDWLDFSDRAPEAKSAPLTLVDLDQIRDHMRKQYLERAAELDKKIGTFHAALPPDLWHLQRTALPRARAERLFDAHIPPRQR
jgi:hypothetical protein